MLKLVERDSYLAPYSLSIEGRYQYFVNRVKQFTKNGRQTKNTHFKRLTNSFIGLKSASFVSMFDNDKK